MLTRKPPPRPGRPDRSDEFASFKLTAARAVMATPASFAGVAKPPAPPPKLPRQARTDTAIRDSANGEDCDMRLEGVCNGRTDTTVLSHFPGLDGDRGMGLKALDLCACYTCCACHDVMDGRARPPEGMTRTDVLLAWFHGHMRTLVKLARKGLV